ncbi:unnamed protein product, partial [marine sediment metagenome]
GCGHGKYPMTIIIQNTKLKECRWDLVSGKMIPRKKKFYRKDSEGYYYVPEVLEYKNRKHVKKPQRGKKSK